jgi:hypothetical protein
MTMTTRELREVLFCLEDQQMTVKELRQMLFEVEDQDAELQPGFAMWKRLEAQHTEHSK